MPEPTLFTGPATPFMFTHTMTILLMVLMVREMIRKGIALWKAGTKKQLTRFIVMFILNTAGILPIIYLIFFQKKGKGK